MLCSLEFVYGNPTPVPHLPVHSHERLASSDSSSQHTALCRSAFSPTAVSCTTSGDKRLPECLACRRFTRTRGWFILALHKQASVYISLVLGLLNQHWGTYTHALRDLHSAHSHSAGLLPHAHTLRHLQTVTHTYRWTLCLRSSAPLRKTSTHTHTHTHTPGHAPLFMSETGYMSVIRLLLHHSCCTLMQRHWMC